MADQKIRTGKKRVYSVFVVVCMIALGITANFGCSYLTRVMNVKVRLNDLGTIPVAALCGMGPGMAVAILTFFLNTFVDASGTYFAFLNMLTAILISAMAIRGCFKSVWKTLLGVAGIAVMNGSLQSALMSAIQGNVINQSNYTVILNEFLNEFLTQFVLFTLLFLFLRFCPDSFLLLFPNGAYYTSKIPARSYQAEHGNRRSSISSKITMMIILIALIIGFETVFAMNMVIKSYGIGFQSAGQAGSQSAAAAPQTGTSQMAADSQVLVYLMGAIIIVALIANWYAQWKIARPITKLADAMDSFAFHMQGDTQENTEKIKKLKIHTGDEIETLYHALEKTAVDMQEYLERLDQEKTLQQELIAAKAASEAKSSFLSNMSHEIRTPINAVLGMDEMILRECRDDTILGYAADIHNAGRTLLGLINDILDYSKIEAGKMEIIPVEYELCSMINDLSNMILNKVNDKHLKLNIDIDKTMPHVLFGDEIRIKQVILNILTNAVKYTETGSVTLSVGYEKKDEEHLDLLICVKDTGIGIKPEDLEKLFHAFERIEEERNRTIEGTGLGMNITKQLLDMMDSHLEVGSVYGEGSEFSFRLTQKVVKWEPIGDAVDTLKKSQNQLKKYQESFHAPKAVLLVVDDTPMNLTVIRNLLKKTQVRVETAESGAACLEMTKEKHYDIIFLDHRMPEMDGIETFHHLKDRGEDALNGKTPIIALTANAVSGMREQYYKEGFNDYLSKPVDAETLERMIQKYLPPQLVERVEKAEEEMSADGKEEAGGKSGEGQAPETEEEKKSREQFERIRQEIPEMNTEDGIAACGDRETYLTVLSEFGETAQSRAKQISRYEAEHDLRNYTVQVHALKSSARLVGAAKLSTLAEELEKCGDEGKEDEIREKTPELATWYLRLAEQINNITSEEQSDAGKEEIGEDSLREAFQTLHELVEGFDFDSADMVMKQLENYRIPEKYQQIVAQLKILMTEVARDDIMKLLEEAPLS